MRDKGCRNFGNKLTDPLMRLTVIPMLNPAGRYYAALARACTTRTRSLALPLRARKRERAVPREIMRSDLLLTHLVW